MVTAYIGDLNDPEFHWENGDYDGNIPKRISSEFPLAHQAWGLIIDKIKDGEFNGKQVDWGAFVAIVNKAELIKFTDEVYDKNPFYWFNDYIQEFKDFIGQLDEDKKYALVACELY